MVFDKPEYSPLSCLLSMCMSSLACYVTPAMACTLINSLQGEFSMQTIFHYCHLVVMACNLCCIFVMNLAKDGISTSIQPKRNVSLLDDRQFNLVIGGNSLTWNCKLKYLGCIIRSGSCELDISPAVGKFYSQFNNIMAVLGKQKNELAAVHLMKSYCLSSLLYACETWSLNVNSVQSANVALNNSFRRIFNCCWRESPKMLLFYCGALPIVHNVDQRRILFYKKLKCHSSALLRVLAKICHPEILSVANKYNINCLDVSAGQVRRCVWAAFADSVM